MEVRSRDLRVAVIIFAGGDHADENRQKAIRLGALAYCYEWASLFREIERVFAPIAPGRGD